MNTFTLNSSSIPVSAPSGGLWSRAASLYWTGWTQYAASLNADTRLRAEFPLPRRRYVRLASTGEAPRQDEGAA